jgi:DivIVA domain-containing protein
MTAAELDLSPGIGAEQVRHRLFATVRRGFDPDQVRDYLSRVADHIARLELELREARLESETTRPARSAAARDPYADFSDRLAEVIRAADRHAEEIVRDARDQADGILRDAGDQADGILRDSRARQTGVMTSRGSSLVDQLLAVQECLSVAAKEVGAALPTVATST